MVVLLAPYRYALEMIRVGRSLPPLSCGRPAPWGTGARFTVPRRSAELRSIKMKGVLKKLLRD